MSTGSRINGPKAAGKSIALNIEFPDTRQEYRLELSNGALNHLAGRAARPDATVRLDRATLNDLVLGGAPVAQAISAGKITITGDRSKFEELLALLDTFELWFDIVTP